MWIVYKRIFIDIILEKDFQLAMLNELFVLQSRFSINLKTNHKKTQALCFFPHKKPKPPPWEKKPPTGPGVPVPNVTLSLQVLSIGRDRIWWRINSTPFGCPFRPKDGGSNKKRQWMGFVWRICFSLLGFLSFGCFFFVFGRVCFFLVRKKTM